MATLSTTVFVLTEAFITIGTTKAMLGLGIQEDRLETTIIITPEVVVPFKIVPELAVQELTVIITLAATPQRVKTVTIWEEGFRTQQIITDQMAPLDKVVLLDPTKSQITGAPGNPVLLPTPIIIHKADGVIIIPGETIVRPDQVTQAVEDPHPVIVLPLGVLAAPAAQEEEDNF
ncbi:MAG: hypothetical protein CMC93_02025 [Flavobacteriaceae bacterium]|nr:hypothetical protein [Flavobacteriaceae bacterium]